MTRQFTLPDLGEGVKEGQVLRLLVSEGDVVEEDQLLMEVETDKSAVEIPSPYAGVIAHWHVSEQQVIEVGDLMVTFGDGPGATMSATTTATATAPTARNEDAKPDGDGRARPPAPARTAGMRTGARRTPASPAIRKLARTLGIDLETVAGTGPGGRVLRADVEAASSGAGTTSVPPPAAAPPAGRPSGPLAGPLSSLPRPPAGPPAGLPAGREDSDSSGPTVRVPITQTRKAIASVMTRSMSTIPHVTDCDDADVTDLDRLRRGYNAAESTGADEKLGLLPFVIRAVARALRFHPILNASFDDANDEIVYRRSVNIAVGVHTGRGLVAPVLQDADRLGVPEINTRLAALVERARSGTFALEDTRGATYTISNAGAMGGSRYSTPIITPPQAAVLAVGMSRRQPAIVDGEIVPRLLMPLSHSMDHRIIDGGQEIAFMKQLIGELENPARMLL